MLSERKVLEASGATTEPEQVKCHRITSVFETDYLNRKELEKRSIKKDSAPFIHRGGKKTAYSKTYLTLAFPPLI